MKAQHRTTLWRDRSHLWRSYKRDRFLWFRNYWKNLWIWALIVGSLWLVEIIDRRYFDGHLQGYGVRAGNWNHWEGIFFGPFLHHDWNHLWRNSMALLIMGPMILVHGWRRLFNVSFVCALGAGLVIMVLGEPHSCHSGASGIVYGYAFYLVTQGVISRTPWSIVAALVTLSFYGFAGFIQWMFPVEAVIQNNISWQGHLGGAIAGFIAGKLFATRQH